MTFTAPVHVPCLPDTLLLALFQGKRDTVPQLVSLSWHELARRLTHHAAREGKDGPLWSPTQYAPGAVRGKANVQAVSCFVADVDDGTAPETLCGRWNAPDGEPLAFCLHSSYSSMPECPKWRVVFPLTTPVSSADWPAVHAALTLALMSGHADPACKDASRMYYLPACPPEARAHAFTRMATGTALDPAWFPAVPAAPRVERLTLTVTPERPETPPLLPFWWTDTVPAGSRNQTSFARARWLLNSYEGSQTQQAAWNTLKAWNMTCCRPPLSEQELRQAFDSARRAGDNPAHALPPAFLSAPALPEWPSLAPDTLHGLAGDIVRAIDPHTEADPVALLVQFLIAFGSCVGRGPHFLAEADKHGGNLFAVLVGVSSKGRKGTSWGHVRSLFERAAPAWAGSRVLSGLSSGEGLIHAVRDPLERAEKNKRSGEMETVTVDEGVQDKRLLVLEGEFASVLRQTQRDGNTLSATLRNAWDTGTLRSMTKNSPAQATGAHVSIVGHITRNELKKDLAETETANGFGNRFLWVCVKRSKELPEGGDMDSVNLAPLVARLHAVLEQAERQTRLHRDGTAREIWHAIYHDLSQGKAGLLGAMTGRSEAQVMRLALLYALLDCDTAIRAEHLTAALALWEYCEASARFIFGDSLGDRMADDILRALRDAEGGLSRNDLRELFGRNQSSERVGQALALLAEQGLAHSVRQNQDGKGRPSEHWRATR